MHFACARRGGRRATARRTSARSAAARSASRALADGAGDARRRCCDEPDRSGPEHFCALHRHGFVRVATSTPRVRPADVGFNRDAILAEARRARRGACRPRGLPRALRLLLRDRRPAPADGAARRGRGGGRRRSSTASAELGAGAPDRRAAAARGPALQLRAGDRARASCSGWCRRASCRTTASTTRSAGSRTAATSPGRAIAVAGREAPFGADLIFAATDLPGFVFHVEICEDFWAPIPPSSRGGARRRDDPRQSLGLEHHHRQVRRAAPALPLAVGARRRRLRLLGRRARARAPPTSPGTARGRSTSSATCSPSPSASRSSRSSASPTSTPGASSASGCGRRPSTTPPRRRGRPEPRVPPRRLRAPAELRGRRAGPPDPPLSLRAEPPDPPRPGLLRGVQHPGRGPAPPLRGRRAATHGDRRLRRARLDARADRRRQGLRPARPAARARSSASPCRASPPARATKTNAWALMRALGVTAEEIDIRPAARQMLARHGPSVRRGRAGLRRRLRERAGRACAPTTCSGSPTSAAAS